MTATDNFHRNFLAHRVLGAKPSATKEMTRLSAQLKREGHDVITLSQGNRIFRRPSIFVRRLKLPSTAMSRDTRMLPARLHCAKPSSASSSLTMV